jgi:hypothetical protein
VVPRGSRKIERETKGETSRKVSPFLSRSTL